MSRFDWGTYNATKGSAGGPVYSWETDWDDVVPGVNADETFAAPQSPWQLAFEIAFVVALVAFFGFLSSIM